MGAEIVEHFDAKAGDLAVARQRHFRRVDAVRPVRVAAQQVLDPVFDPFDMAPAGLARQQCHTDDRVGKNLGAEGAAVGQRRNANLVRRQPQAARHRRDVKAGALETAPGIERMIGTPLHNTIAGLDRIAAGPEPTKIVFDDDIRFGKSLVDRAKGKQPMVNQVGALVLPNDRAVRIERLLRHR